MKRPAALLLLALAALAGCSSTERSNPFDSDGGTNASAAFQPYLALRVYEVSSVPVSNAGGGFQMVPTNILFMTGGRASEFEAPSGFFSTYGERIYTLSEEHLFSVRYNNPTLTLERHFLGLGTSVPSASLAWNAGSVNPKGYFRFIPEGTTGKVWMSTNSNTLAGFETNTLQPVAGFNLPLPVGEPNIELGSVWFDGSNAFYLAGKTLVRAGFGGILWTNRILTGGQSYQVPKMAWNGGATLAVLTEYGQGFRVTKALLVNASNGAVTTTVSGVGEAFSLGGLRVDGNRPEAVESIGGQFVYITAGGNGMGPRFLQTSSGANPCRYLYFSPPTVSDGYLIYGSPGLVGQPSMYSGRGIIRYWRAVP